MGVLVLELTHPLKHGLSFVSGDLIRTECAVCGGGGGGGV